jgi:hypothetical protein
LPKNGFPKERKKYGNTANAPKSRRGYGNIANRDVMLDSLK